MFHIVFYSFNELAGAENALETRTYTFLMGERNSLWNFSPSFQKWLHVYSTENHFHI